jgi:hypothetical protein
MDGDATTNLQKFAWTNTSSGGTLTSSTANSAVFESASSSDETLCFSGMIRLDSGGVLSVWIAQNVSSATAIEIKWGALTVTRVGAGV